MLILALLLAAAAAWFGPRQAPHPDMWRPLANWDLARGDWWAYPLERNAFKRVVVRGHLNALFVLPDASQAWAVGSGGLILHTGDAGLHWKQLNPRPAVAAPARSARGFELLSSAHAEIAAPSKEAPRDLKLDAANRPSTQQNAARQEPLPNAPTGAVQSAPRLSDAEIKLLEAKKAAATAPSKGVAPRPRPNLPPQGTASSAAPVRPAASAASAAAPTAAAPVRRDPLAAELRAVTFVDAQRGWIAGEDDVLLATSDGGASWSPQPTGMNVPIHAIAFQSDGLQGWAVGDGGRVSATRDGGRTWSARAAPSGGKLFGVSLARDGQRAWVAGDDGVFFSADGGQTWRLQSRAKTALRGLQFLPDGERGWAAGDAGQLMSTRDGGQTWLERPSGSPADLAQVFFLADGQRGWVVGAGGTLLASTDGGATWAPKLSRTKAHLRGIGMVGDAGFSVGDDGSLLATRDGGSSWRRQASGLKAWLSDVQFFDDGLRGIAVGADAALLATRDGGVSWSARDDQGTARLQRLSRVAEPPAAWTVGEGGLILTSRDAGTNWQPLRSGTTLSLNGVHFAPDAQRGWAVGNGGSVLASADGGQSWSPQTSRTDQALADVAFSSDGQRGWAVGRAGSVIATRDSGRTWAPQPQLGASAPLRSVALTPDGQRIWVAGDEGAIRASIDGGQSWRSQPVVGAAALNRLQFLPDGQRGWVVGNAGLAAFTRDGGAGWTIGATGSSAALNGLSFLADGKRGWLVGEHGSVLASNDGGATWTALAEYRRYPAPWMFAALLLSAALLGYTILFGTLRAPASPATTRQVPQVLSALLTDSPLTDLNDDRLGHGPAVLALSDFMRNRDTEPKLTLAITAPWGMGKSSMMGMLRSELHKAGFRSAWFNAWHHQQEGRQLSALFNVIRKQAVPSIFSQPIAALRVRARLLWARGWAYRLGIPLLALPLLALLAADLDRGRRDGELSLRELARWNFSHHWLKEPRVAISGHSLVKLNPFVSPVPPAAASAPAASNVQQAVATARNPCDAANPARKPDAVLRSEVYCYLQRAVVLQADGEREACGVQQALIRTEAAQRKHGLCIFESAEQLFDIADASIPWKRSATATGGDPARYLLPSERQAILGAAEVLAPPPMLPTIEHFIPLLALLGLLMTKGLSVYGLQLLNPLRSLLGGRAGAAEAVEPTGTVERYRTEFCLLTEALDGRLVIFIDDLDRCDKDTVNSMLEMTNYLIDHGKCFIVLGAAMEHVKRCIEPKAEVLDKDKFQTEYLRKIVHIELPVPTPSEHALEALLNGRATAPSAGEQRWYQRWAARAVAVTKSARPPLLVLAVLLLALWVADLVQRSVRAPQQSPHVAAVEAAVPASAAAAPVAASPAASAAQPAELRSADRPASGAVGLASGSTDWNPLVPALGVAALLLLAAWWVRRSGTRFDRLRVALGGVVRTADSPQFMAALSLWKPAVRLYDPTPRGLKRFCNRARLFAIHERSSHPEADTQEVHVVALTAMHHVRPKLLERIAEAAQNGRSLEEWLADHGFDDAVDKALLACLKEHVSAWGFADQATIVRFSELLGQISVR